MPNPKKDKKIYHVTDNKYKYPFINPNYSNQSLGFGGDVFGTGFYATDDKKVLKGYIGNNKDAIVRQQKIPSGATIIDYSNLQGKWLEAVTSFIQGQYLSISAYNKSLPDNNLFNIFEHYNVSASDRKIVLSILFSLCKENNIDVIKYPPGTIVGIPSSGGSNYLILSNDIINNPRKNKDHDTNDLFYKKMLLEGRFDKIPDEFFIKNPEYAEYRHLYKGNIIPNEEQTLKMLNSGLQLRFAYSASNIDKIFDQIEDSKIENVFNILYYLPGGHDVVKKHINRILPHINFDKLHLIQDIIEKKNSAIFTFILPSIKKTALKIMDQMNLDKQDEKYFIELFNAGLQHNMVYDQNLDFVSNLITRLDKKRLFNSYGTLFLSKKINFLTKEDILEIIDSRYIISMVVKNIEDYHDFKNLLLYLNNVKTPHGIGNMEEYYENRLDIFREIFKINMNNDIAIKLMYSFSGEDLEILKERILKYGARHKFDSKTAYRLFGDEYIKAYNEYKININLFNENKDENIMNTERYKFFKAVDFYIETGKIINRRIFYPNIQEAILILKNKHPVTTKILKLFRKFPSEIKTNPEVFTEFIDLINNKNRFTLSIYSIYDKDFINSLDRDTQKLLKEKFIG